MMKIVYPCLDVVFLTKRFRLHVEYETFQCRCKTIDLPIWFFILLSIIFLFISVGIFGKNTLDKVGFSLTASITVPDTSVLQEHIIKKAFLDDQENTHAEETNFPRLMNNFLQTVIISMSKEIVFKNKCHFFSCVHEYIEIKYT